MKDSLSMQYITQSKLKDLHRNRMISNADINQNLSLIKTNNVHTQELKRINVPQLTCYSTCNKLSSFCVEFR